MSEESFLQTLSRRHGYTSISEIGRGGMGVVYRARDPKLHRDVAVKRLSTELLDAESSLRRFESEMVTLGRVNHSAVVKIHFADFTESNDAYFVMDYIPGKNLGALIRERRQTGERFTIGETVDLLRPIASALDHLHRDMDPPVIHRDIKPGNILVPSGVAMEAKSLLTDFGISLSAEDTRMTSLSMMIGTEKYFAPELLPGGVRGGNGIIHNQPTADSDNYALTLIAFEMLTLRSYKDTMTTDAWGSPERPAPQLSTLGLNRQDYGDIKSVEAVFKKALNPAPAYRFASAIEFVQYLARTGNHPSRQNPPKPPTTTQSSNTTVVPRLSHRAPLSPQRINPWLSAMLGLIIIVLAGILGAGVWFMINHPIWGQPQRDVAQAFPQIVPNFQDLRGWNALKCKPEHSADTAQITCLDEDLTLQIHDFGDLEAREDFVIDGQERVGWTRDACEIVSVRVAENTYALLPQSVHEQYAVVVEGADAEQQHYAVPVC